MHTIDHKILSRFYGQGRGYVATPKDFTDIGGRSYVDNAFARLVQANKLHRIGRGLYEYPRIDPVLGLLSPDLDRVARALAGREGIRLQPTGAYAANQLGLSEQVPMQIVFLTDGASRKAVIGPHQIELRRASPRRMQLAGKVSGLVFEALRELGADHIDENTEQRLRKTLSSEEKRKVRRDLPQAPAWMHPILRRVTKE